MQEAYEMRGHIFACTSKTEKECLERLLFASNKIYENKVMQVKKGDLLFLFNIDNAPLYGVFKALSDGAKNIVPEAWNGNYPYQVRVKRYGKIRKFEDSRKIMSKLGIPWHKSLDSDMLEMLLGLFNNKKGVRAGAHLYPIFISGIQQRTDTGPFAVPFLYYLDLLPIFTIYGTRNPY